jgi:hypothetical protein
MFSMDIGVFQILYIGKSTVFAPCAATGWVKQMMEGFVVTIVSLGLLPLKIQMLNLLARGCLTPDSEDISYMARQGRSRMQLPDRRT